MASLLIALSADDQHVLNPSGITRDNVAFVDQLIRKYRSKHGTWPPAKGWSNALLLEMVGERDLLRADWQAYWAVMHDGWGRALIYKVPGRHNVDGFDLYSRGANGVDEQGKEDDIGNWAPGRGPK